MTTTLWKSIASPLGPIVLAAVPEGLIGAWFPGQAHFAGVQPDWRHDRAAAGLIDAERQLAEWFAGRRRDFDLPLAPVGTPFQRQVWAAIRRVAYGATTSYGSVAAELGQSQAARAVGAATGRNPFSIIVPCHRLVGQRGALTGYAGGLDKKRALLAFEAAGAPFELVTSA